MTSLAVRWLHHSTAPSRTTEWFRRACLVAALLVSAASTAGAVVLSRRDPLEGVYGPIVTSGWVGGLACISSIALVATVLSGLKVDSGDVHAFPGHIACDAASRSEIVVPLVHDGVLVGVFDIDSPEPARFDVVDQEGIEAIARLYVETLK